MVTDLPQNPQGAGVHTGCGKGQSILVFTLRSVENNCGKFAHNKTGPTNCMQFNLQACMLEKEIFFHPDTGTSCRFSEPIFFLLSSPLEGFG
jgi:hypothetical protein